MDCKFSSEELVNGCIARDRKCQAALYSLYSRKMFGICLGYLKNYDSAKDVLQEGFIKVFQNIKNYSGEGSLEAWVRKIIINTAIDNYRKSVRLSITTLRFEEDNYEQIDNSILSKINEDELLYLIKLLPEGARIIFNLYVIEGYAHHEIAEKLCISIGTSKSQLNRAKQLLREHIKINYGEEYILNTYEERILQVV